MKKIVVVIILLVLIAVGYVYLQRATSEDFLVGGSWSDDHVPGMCTIAEVRPSERVSFDYVSEDGSEILENQTLNMVNSWPLSLNFVEKYKVEEEKVFECELLKIKRGTCSPIYFEFENIDLIDYDAL